MTPEERYARAQRAEKAWNEFAAPAFEVIEAEYTRKLTELAAETPWEAARITKLAMALKIARAVQGQFKALMADGVDASMTIDRAGQIARIPDHKRRILGL